MTAGSVPARFSVKLLLAAAALLVVLTVGSVWAEQWSFAVFSDHCAGFAAYRNVLNEVRRQTVNPEKKVPPFDFVLAVGDLSPAEENFRIFREVFGGTAPAYFPVRGNHERPRDVRFLLDRIMPLHGEKIRLHDKKSLTYHADWKNVRVIVLDQYAGFGKAFDRGAALGWLKGALETPDAIRHVFVAFHEPNLPFFPEEDPFWKLLVQHQDKVRAVFAGHTHVYGRRRFPDRYRGIFFVNTGNAGQNNHSDGRQTITEVLVDGEKVSYLVVQAPDGTPEFSVREQW